MTLTINTDGGARGNPGPAACAAVVKKEQDIVAELTHFLGIATNNTAEYQGVLLAYRWLAENTNDKGSTTLVFYLDSLLVVSQLSGKYKVKSPQIAEFVYQAKQYEKEFKKVSFHYIPRLQNENADILVNKCLDENISG